MVWHFAYEFWRVKDVLVVLFVLGFLLNFVSSFSMLCLGLLMPLIFSHLMTLGSFTWLFSKRKPWQGVIQKSCVLHYCNPFRNWPETEYVVPKQSIRRGVCSVYYMVPLVWCVLYWSLMISEWLAWLQSNHSTINIADDLCLAFSSVVCVTYF